MSEQNRHLANIALHTKNTWNKLCELVESFTPISFTVTGANCDGGDLLIK